MLFPNVKLWKKRKKSWRILVIRSLSLSSTCSGHSFSSRLLRQHVRRRRRSETRGEEGWLVEKKKKNLPRGTASPWGEEGDRSRLMSYGTAPRGGCMALMTVQSLAFGGYMLGTAELWFEVHMQKGGGLGRVGWQTGSSQSAKSDTQAAAAEGASAGTTKHLYLLKDSTIAPQTEKHSARVWILWRSWLTERRRKNTEPTPSIRWNVSKAEK